MQITFKDKQITCEQLATGVAKKTESVYYVYDQGSSEWKYCSKQRLDSLIKKYGSLEEISESYTSRKSNGTTSSAKRDKVVKENVDADITARETKGWLWIDPAMREKDYDGKF